MSVVDFSIKRVNELIDSVWNAQKGEDCVWWQGEWWSWERLRALADDCEEKLRASGFSEGHRVAALLPNSPMVIALSIACWRLGGAIAPLNARTGAVNLSDTIKMLDVHAVVLTADGCEKAAETGFLPGIPLVSAPLEGPLPAFRGRGGLAEAADIAVIFSTSGTSGLPKAVPCRHSNIIGNLSPVIEHVPSLISDDGVTLNVLPNFHTFGFTMTGMLSIVYGMKQALIPSFVPVDNTIRVIKEAGVNRIIAVPTVMAFLLGALAKKNERLRGITHVITGGDRLNVQMDERSREYLGVGIIEGYGLTECSPVVAVNRSEEARKLGTVGQIFPGYQVEIRDRDGKPLDIHQEGVLWVKGPSVVSGYFRDEKNTKERFRDGWFNTGDVVRIDEEGYVKIVDRATDIIIVSGFNVYPQEVEAVLCRHPAVSAAVAVGEKNKVAGELVKAFIIVKDGAQLTAKELTDYCRERLAHYKVPRKIGFVSEYPISPTGKILRRELRKMKIEKD
ncbi:MAG: AMP-binding protein [Synergistaceae bacterium]|nr:AMP-binding protein [Synergistaceae bacterium]